MENNQTEMTISNKQDASVRKIETPTGIIELSPEIIRRYLVSGEGYVTDEEITMFMGLCSANRLNPFNKEAYLIKYGSKPATMVISKDVFFKRATSNPQYNGMKSGIIVLKDDNIEKRNGHVYVKGKEILLGAWCEVFRKDWDNSIYQEVNFDEYAGYTKEGKLNSQWASKPAVMITKVAEGTALRKAFTEVLQNMYIAEEVDATKTTYSKEMEDIVPIKDILEGDEE